MPPLDKGNIVVLHATLLHTLWFVPKPHIIVHKGLTFPRAYKDMLAQEAKYHIVAKIT
jgi:hypothetical protein